MRKIFSIVLAFAMVITMFAGIVFAAEKTNKQLLGEAGIIIGGTEGVSLDNLSWKREDVVVLLTRLYGKSELEMKNTAKTHTYTDVSNTYYDGFISWLVGEKLINGRSDTIFGFGDPITAQEFATLLLRVSDVQFEFKDAIKVAVGLGIFTETLPNQSEVSRQASYDGIINTLNLEDENNVSLGKRLQLNHWLQEEPPMDSPPVSEDNSDDTLMVEVTIEESFFFGASIDDIKAEAKLIGIDDVILNADGSITYRMTKKKHNDIINDMKSEVYNWIDETVNHMDSVSKITINDAFTELRVSANESEFTRKADQVQFIGISFQVAFIQLFDLVKPEDVQFKIFYINEDTGATFYSDELENNN